MSASAFDSLAYFEKLKSAGVPEGQARIQTDTWRDLVAALDEKIERSSRQKAICEKPSCAYRKK